MAVGLRAGRVITEIGTQRFLHCFFSTISRHLEPQGWGTVYPELMNELYQGELDVCHMDKVLHDVLEIRDKLRSFPPNAVVWDYEDLSARPPWGDDISADITDLSNYFVTSTGRDLFSVFIENLEWALASGQKLTIEPV